MPRSRGATSPSAAKGWSTGPARTPPPGARAGRRANETACLFEEEGVVEERSLGFTRSSNGVKSWDAFRQRGPSAGTGAREPAPQRARRPLEQHSRRRVDRVPSQRPGVLLGELPGRREERRGTEAGSRPFPSASGIGVAAWRTSPRFAAAIPWNRATCRTAKAVRGASAFPASCRAAARERSRLASTTLQRSLRAFLPRPRPGRSPRAARDGRQLRRPALRAPLPGVGDRRKSPSRLNAIAGRRAPGRALPIACGRLGRLGARGGRGPSRGAVPVSGPSEDARGRTSIRVIRGSLTSASVNGGENLAADGESPLSPPAPTPSSAEPQDRASPEPPSEGQDRRADRGAEERDTVSPSPLDSRPSPGRREAFDLFDADGSGTIDAKELKVAMR